MQQTAAGANGNSEAKKKQTDNNGANVTVKSVEAKKKIEDEDKIAVQITVPPDGGWGWVVLGTAFFIYFINDGIMLSYGNVIEEFKRNLNLSLPFAALINSATVGTYFCSGPLVSGLINRFGFRFCAMFGAAIAALANILANIIETYGALLFFCGVIAGFGYSMANMSAIIILGFYFSKWRAFAFTTAVSGASTGIFLFGIIYGSISSMNGWRITLLLQASLLAIEYFAASCFRPLLTVTVEKKIEKKETQKDNSPPETESQRRRSVSRKSIDEEAHMSERIFKTPSNSNFPTVAEIISEPQKGINIPADDSAPGPSNEGGAKLELVFNNPDEEFHHKEIEMVKSIAAETHAKYNENQKIANSDLSIQTLDMSLQSVKPAPKKHGFWKSVFHWEKHVEESRPMYRDDVFYEGSVKNLHRDSKTPTFSKSLEYQLEVSRAAAASDLNENKGMLTTSTRRVLATMLDPQLLKKKSFLLICIGVFFINLGYLIPLVYVAMRGDELAIPSKFYTMFVSTMGFSGIFGRIAIGRLALKVDPLIIAALANFVAGLSTLASCFLKTKGFQYLYCIIYGFVTSGSTSTRGLFLVQLFGMDRLTNCTGIIVMFQGVGCLLGTPIGGFLRETFSFDSTFIFAAICFFIGSLCFIIVYVRAKREVNALKLNAKNHWKNIEAQLT